MKLEEGQTILCTVTRIQGTTVFLQLPDGSEGTMIFSEVSPGRIRNIREYVVPNKKIVCKVLRVKGNHVELSLRRVTPTEREIVLDKNKKEKQLLSMLKPITKSAEEIIIKIKEKYEIPEFLEEAKENPKIISKFLKATEAKKLEKILAEKKEAEKEVRKIITITSQNPSGIQEIKEILDSDAEIKYLGSSRFSIRAKAKDYKTANGIIDAAVKEIEKKAKKYNAKLDIKDDKIKPK